MHLELAAAFKRNIAVIPVLVEGALIPRYDELPDGMKALARRNGFPLSYDRSRTEKQATRFCSEFGMRSDLKSLVSVVRWVLEKIAAENRKQEEKERLKAEQCEQDSLQVDLLEKERLEAEMRAKGHHEAEQYEKEWFQKALATILASGNFLREAVHRTVDVRAETERRPVDCTVFAPNCVQREQIGLLQAFLHAPEARMEAEVAAKEFDSNATERGYRSLVLDAPVGTTFAFDVEIDGFVFHERTETLLWTGKPQAATFSFDVPEDCNLGQHVGTVRISQDGAPVGRITFQIEVVLDAPMYGLSLLYWKRPSRREELARKVQKIRKRWLMLSA